MLLYYYFSFYYTSSLNLHWNIDTKKLFNSVTLALRHYGVLIKTYLFYLKIYHSTSVRFCQFLIEFFNFDLILSVKWPSVNTVKNTGQIIAYPVFLLLQTLYSSCIASSHFPILRTVTNFSWCSKLPPSTVCLSLPMSIPTHRSKQSITHLYILGEFHMFPYCSLRLLMISDAIKLL